MSADAPPIHLGHEVEEVLQTELGEVDDLEVRVLAYVGQHPGASVRQIRGNLQRRAQDVGETVVQLVEEGRLDDRGDTWRRLYVPTAPDERREPVQEPREPAWEPFLSSRGTRRYPNTSRRRREAVSEESVPYGEPDAETLERAQALLSRLRAAGHTVMRLSYPEYEQRPDTVSVVGRAQLTNTEREVVRALEPALLYLLSTEPSTESLSHERLRESQRRIQTQGLERLAYLMATCGGLYRGGIARVQRELATWPTPKILEALNEIRHDKSPYTGGMSSSEHIEIKGLLKAEAVLRDVDT